MTNDGVFKMKVEWIQALKPLPADIRCAVIDEIVRYGALGDAPTSSDPVIQALVKSYTDQIDRIQDWVQTTQANTSENKEKNTRIYDMAMAGMTAKSIAEELGLNPKRVYDTVGWKRARDEKKLMKMEGAAISANSVEPEKFSGKQEKIPEKKEKSGIPFDF